MHLFCLLFSDINFFLSRSCEETTPTLLLETGICHALSFGFSFGENVKPVQLKALEFYLLFHFYTLIRFFSLKGFTIIPITSDLQICEQPPKVSTINASKKNAS